VVAPAAPTTPFAPGSEAFFRHLIDTVIPQGPIALRHALHTYPQLPELDYFQQVITTLPASTRQLMNSVINAALSAQNPSQPPSVQAQAQAQGPPQATSITSTTSTAQTQVPMAPLPNQQPVGVPAGPQPPMIAPHTNPTPPAVPAANPPAHAAHGTHHHLPANMLRVFKLQFDARRIICCSQTSTIVGWDFANGDEQIIEASRFFAPIE
jgi:F-box and WD-40 domain protein 1/11